MDGSNGWRSDSNKDIITLYCFVKKKKLVKLFIPKKNDFKKETVVLQHSPSQFVFFRKTKGCQNGIAPVASVVPNHRTNAVHFEVLGVADPLPGTKGFPRLFEIGLGFKHQGIY